MAEAGPPAPNGTSNGQSTSDFSEDLPDKPLSQEVLQVVVAFLRKNGLQACFCVL